MIQTIEDGRKQDGNRSIADKIIKRLHDLEKTVESNYGRWAWELLQNAKDSIADDTRTVDICLKREGDVVSFLHNGNHFTEHDIRGLINQISSKEVEEGQKSTRVGKFGTGFITTHLLSKIVIVKGIVETAGNEFYQFEFPLDREGNTTSILAPKIETTWFQFHQSANRLSSIDSKQIKTSFTYLLSTDKHRTTAKEGIEEFIRLIPYVLAFIPKIGKVKIINESQFVEFERHKNLKSDFIVQITRTENNQTQNIQIALCQNEIAAVAVEINTKTNAVKEFKDVPRLFCDFPLIGTEKFYFPVVVNSFYFNPTTERDGIWLKGSEDEEVEINQILLIEAVSLYKDLLTKLSSSSIRELYHAAETKLPDTNEKYFDAEWYKSEVQQKLREAIINIPIVDTVSGERKSIEVEDGGYVDFPHHNTKKVRERLWELGNKLERSILILPEKTSIDFWDEIIWNKEYFLDVEQFAIFFTSWTNKLESFSEIIGESGNVFEWLNEFYALIIEEKKSELFDQYAIVPNQNGTFKKISEQTRSKKTIFLYIDEIKDKSLLDILKLLGSDWKEFLIHDEIHSIYISTEVLKKVDIASAISKLFNEYNGDWSENAIINAIVLLTEWFENNQDLGKELFPELYRRRAEFFMKTIAEKGSLYQIMKSNTPLSTLSEIALAIENDPEILNIIAQRQQEKQQEKERNEIGEAVEQILAEVLRDSGFTVEKTHVGRDLIVSLNGRFSFDIEVKSTNTNGFVSMTPTQARTAVESPNNYALCVVNKNGQTISKKYVKANAKFVLGIGILIKAKFDSMANFNISQRQLLSNTDDISLLFENSLNYKYKVSQNIWKRGLDLQAFIQFVKSKV